MPCATACATAALHPALVCALLPAGVPRNLLLRFKDDFLDESTSLNALFMESRTFSPDVDMRTLPGGHLRPLQQALVDLPPPVAKAANQAVAASGDLLGGCCRLRLL